MTHHEEHEREPRDTDDTLLEEQQDKGYGEDEGERGAAFDEPGDEPAQ